MNERIKICAFCLALILAGMADNVTQADTYIWNNPGGGSFESPTNWNPSGPIPGPPTSQDVAIFDLPASYTVIIGTAFSDNLSILAGDITYDLFGGSTYQVTSTINVGGLGPVSLRVNEGTLSAETFNILDGATVRGNGLIGGFFLNVANGGAIRGNLDTSAAGFGNHGLIAPGNELSGGDEIGIIDITQTGGFQQHFDGTLEIEISGDLPIPTNDVLNFGGNFFTNQAILGGQLRVPFINGYAPQPNDSFTFFNTTVPGSTFVGRFDTLSVPGLAPNLAARIDYAPTTTSITFVAPVTVGFNSGNLLPPPGPNNWGDSNFWGGQVPDSTSVVNVRNLENGERVIELNPNVTGSENAFVHQITLSGQNHEMALRLPTGTNFTAVDRLTVSNLGELQLAGGTAHSKLVKVNPGGQIVGNGVISGDVLLGTTTGTLQATLSPGFSSGQITIEENLTVAQNGVVEIEIFADNDFDTVIVGEDANLGGTLMVDLSAATPAALVGEEFVILTAGDVNQTFSEIDVMGAPDYFFQPDYSEQSLALLLFGDGDMNCDGDYTIDDVEKFAMALTNPIGYFSQFEIFGEDSGDMNDDGFFDFDDIDDFSQIDFGGLTAEEVVAYLLEYTAPAVPEPSAALLFALGSALLTGTTGRVQRRRSSIAS